RSSARCVPAPIADATRHKPDAWLTSVQASTPPFSVEKDAGYRGVCPATSQLHTLWGGAALPWNQWQLSRFIAHFSNSKKRNRIYSACPRRGDQARFASHRLPRRYSRDTTAQCEADIYLT